MKLSNKILLGFFGFVFLYMTAAFAELRFMGIPNVINKTNSVAETVDISGIRYLILNDCSREINVVPAERPHLEVLSFSGNVLKTLKYEIAGDTLTIAGLESQDSRNIQFTVFVPNSSLKAIHVKSSTLIIEGLKQDALQITGDAGRVWMSGVNIAKIGLDITNKSLLDISKATLDTMEAKITESQLIVSSPVGSLKGTVENHSLVRLNEVEEIQLKKDLNSDLNIFR